MKDIVELQDFGGTLGELRSIIQKYIDKYGEDTKVSFDAGYNNVSVIMENK